MRCLVKPLSPLFPFLAPPLAAAPPPGYTPLAVAGKEEKGGEGRENSQKRRGKRGVA